MEQLIIKGNITIRTAEKMLLNKELFILVISKLPLDYIYPEFYNLILKKSSLLMQNIDYVFGYRERKQNSRPNRDYALMQLDQSKKIIEPKNFQYNQFYDKINKNLDVEMTSNIVVAESFKEYVKVMKI